jgi:glyoxylase-like metal-dependent hydrolase (beta-lactamase superfamily II)/rhodanese-related sulfurtransferase
MKEISTEELLLLRKSGDPHTLLDCRGPDYFRWEHIPGAKNVRWKYLQEKSAALLPRRTELIITYCQSYLCDASVKGYEALVKLGYRNVLEYSGGIEEWRARGQSTASTPDARVSPRAYRFADQRFYESEVGCYLIETEDKIILVDGPQVLTEDIEDFILNFGKPLSIFLTHDATGGAADKLREKYGARVYLHAADREGKWLSVKPTDFIEDNFSFGDGLSVIHTPGHTPGSSCLFDEKFGTLFSGDHLAGAANNGPLMPFDSRDLTDRNRALWDKNVARIRKLGPTALLPFHYAMVRENLGDKLSELLK